MNETDILAVLITTIISRVAIINKRAIMMIVANRAIKTSIITINTMTKEAPKAAMGLFHPHH